MVASTTSLKLTANGTWSPWLYTVRGLPPLECDAPLVAEKSAEGVLQLRTDEIESHDSDDASGASVFRKRGFFVWKYLFQLNLCLLIANKTFYCLSFMFLLNKRFIFVLKKVPIRNIGLFLKRFVCINFLKGHK